MLGVWSGDVTYNKFKRSTTEDTSGKTSFTNVLKLDTVEVIWSPYFLVAIVGC